MGRSVFETVLGAIVLVLAAVFMMFAYSSADLKTVHGYMLRANFPMVDGLKEGLDVKINGVKVRFRHRLAPDHRTWPQPVSGQRIDVDGSKHYFAG